MLLLRLKNQERASEGVQTLDLLVHAFSGVMNGGKAWDAMTATREKLQQIVKPQEPREATQEEINAALALAGVPIQS